MIALWLRTVVRDQSYSHGKFAATAISRYLNQDVVPSQYVG